MAKGSKGARAAGTTRTKKLVRGEAVSAAAAPGVAGAAKDEPAGSKAAPAPGPVPQPAAEVVSYPEVERRSPVQAADNLAVAWRPRGFGAGELLLTYEGPLASQDRDAVFARAGTLRCGGQPWSETRDVPLVRQAPNRLVGVIPVPAGAPVEAINLAFHAGEAWDNGGRAPLGFYEWSAREQRIEAR